MEAKKGEKKKGGKAALALLLIAGAVVGGYFLYKHFRKKPEGENEEEPKVERKERKALDESVKRLEFETAKAIIKDSSKQSLIDLAKVMIDDPALKLKIAGHTDNVGNAQGNLVLSKARAQAVADFLTANGVAGNRFEVKGFGEDQPIANNNTPEGRAQNRRVEMQFFT